MNEIIRAIEMEQLRTDIPKFSIGDTVRVQVKVVEGNRERLQAFEGTVIARRNGSCRETFTVRRVSYGIGVERTFPIHSPRADPGARRLRIGKVRLVEQQNARLVFSKLVDVRVAARLRYARIHQFDDHIN